MTTVHMEDFDFSLSALVDRAPSSEPFLVARQGKPVLKVEVLSADTSSEPFDTGKRFGFLKGQGTVPDDFNTMFAAEIVEMFDPEHD